MVHYIISSMNNGNFQGNPESESLVLFKTDMKISFHNSTQLPEVVVMWVEVECIAFYQQNKNVSMCKGQSK